MTPNLEGRLIALAEGRQLEELARMLEREGARILRCPLISMHDSPDTEAVLTWIRELIADRFSLLVLMTGEGVRRLLGFAERAGLRMPMSRLWVGRLISRADRNPTRH